MFVKVHVTLKKSVLDPQGEAIKKGLLSLGYDEVDGVRLGKYFELEVHPRKGQHVETRVREMCEKLLSNPVIESYTIDISEGH